MNRSPRFSLALFILCSLPSPAVAQTGFSIEPGDVLWRGAVNGLDRRQKTPVFELAPDGRSFLYLQGLPWPRLMLQRIEPVGAEPEMLGTQAPFGGRVPRFHPNGEFVFFTVELDWRPRRFPRGTISKANKVLRTAVYKISVDGMKLQRISPAAGAPLNAFALFLDLHPNGSQVLVGSGTELRTFEAQAGTFDVQVEEISVVGGQARRLGFEVSGAAFVRYSADGRSVIYSQDPSAVESAPLIRYDLASGVHQPLSLDAFGGGWRSGRLEITPTLLYHPGSFGDDPYILYSLRRSLDSGGVVLRVPEGYGNAETRGIRPLTIRDRHLLLTRGEAGRHGVMVARWDSEASKALLRRAERHPELSVDRSLKPVRERLAQERARCVVRAEGPAEAQELIGRLARSLAGEGTASIDAVKVRWKQQLRATEGPLSRTIEVLESAEGDVRIEKWTPPERPEDAPMREVVTFDGDKCQVTGDDGKVSPFSRRALQLELNRFSPYQLLLDPCGLASPLVEFTLVDDNVSDPVPGAILGFRFVDGYHGKIYLQINDQEVLPVRITSPLGPLSESVGETPPGRAPTERRITFENYRSFGGRKVPYRLTFEGRGESYVLEVEEIVFN